MLSPWILLSIILGYLLLLFSVAYIAERKELQGKSLVANPYVYSLSLAVYCASWTFYGSVGKAANAGLGLSISYSIIKDHGGSIEIESEKGKGTKFIIKMPVEG